MVRLRSTSSVGKGVKSIYDEIYGYIPVSELELKVIETPTLQRLRRIKQLALAWYVYPGAVHTRFSHSLGVMHVIGIIASKFIDEGYIKRDDYELLRIAGVLHDIGHTPYSHAIELYMTQAFKVRHEEMATYVIENDPYLNEVFSKYGVNPKEVSSIIRGTHKEPLHNMLLSSDLDADRIDYLLRDSLHTGVAYGMIDIDRILHTLMVDKDGEIAVPAKSVQAIENFYIARMHMYRAVYHHKTIAAFQVMMKTIYEMMLNELREYLEPFTTISNILSTIKKGTFYLWDDNYIAGLMNLTLVKNLGSDDLKDLIRLLFNRVGYKAVYDKIKLSREPLSVRENEEAISLSNLKDLIINGLGYKDFMAIPYVEELNLVDEDLCVKILDNESTTRITEFESSIINSIPRYIAITRLYVHPYILDKVRNMIRK
ncbi:MAG: HD domain-containing protein [Sulfolobales archaeon]|nr:HD domain-containing protein [Sulfolobales archaeon]MCX8186136.1 HD domain-containing protein [Sulfolobales archaeon]MDW7969431.1 HD domain-containing protein [Sulfolobales archaeon]